MIGQTHAMSRVASGIALAGATVALATPNGLAGSKPNYGPPDPWAIPYLTATSRGFLTDTTYTARNGQQPLATVSASGGFDWSAFGIGVAVGMAGLLALGVLAARTGRLRRFASA